MATKSAAKPAVKPAAKPAAAKAAAKPMAKTAVKPAARPVTKAAAAAKPASKTTTSQRLLGAADLMGALNLSDEFYAIAYNIETSMLNAGAVPGKDYSRLDLYKLAQPFVLELFKGNDKFSYTYPATEVAKP
ncbi:MAG: hypothetical protein KGN39_04710 [Betaproteobacteria bacterium]|nr:hypothetical protein [Betaproteobacteria bacterium]